MRQVIAHELIRATTIALAIATYCNVLAFWVGAN